jgi:hypothetical protein
MKKTLVLLALLAAAGIAAADETKPAARTGDDTPAPTAMEPGVLLTGATSSATANNPVPVVIRLDTGRELLADAIYGTGNRYRVRGARLLGPGGYPVHGFVVDSKRMEGVPANKDQLLTPGARITFVELD